MRESVIEKHLVDAVKALGGEVRKVKWIGRRGAPDRLVMLPDRGRHIRVINGYETPFYKPAETIWVELKRTGGKAKFPSNAHERAQHREHERMRAMGQRVEIIDSIEGIAEMLGINEV